MVGLTVLCVCKHILQKHSNVSFIEHLLWAWNITSILPHYLIAHNILRDWHNSIYFTCGKQQCKLWFQTLCSYPGPVFYLLAITLFPSRNGLSPPREPQSSTLKLPQKLSQISQDVFQILIEPLSGLIISCHLLIYSTQLVVTSSHSLRNVA
jgi:hypothetical protein